MTILNQEDWDQSAMMAEFDSQDAMMTPFLLSFEELEGTINRCERDGFCSNEVAEAAREKIKELIWKLDLLILQKIRLQRRFRTAERVSR
jgi:hypothetical protein